jgi:hypothetical protein
MARIKRVFNLRVRDTSQMLDLMKKLGTFNMDLEAESRPESVRIVAHGTGEDIRRMEVKIREIITLK